MGTITLLACRLLSLIVCNSRSEMARFNGHTVAAMAGGGARGSRQGAQVGRNEQSIAFQSMVDYTNSFSTQVLLAYTCNWASRAYKADSDFAWFETYTAFNGTAHLVPMPKGTIFVEYEKDLGMYSSDRELRKSISRRHSKHTTLDYVKLGRNCAVAWQINHPGRLLPCDPKQIFAHIAEKCGKDKLEYFKAYVEFVKLPFKAKQKSPLRARGSFGAFYEWSRKETRGQKRRLAQAASGRTERRQ
jgi:hypothetical protein